MPAYTPNRNLYLPGGGSLGIGGADENADIDKLNLNFQALDTWSGQIDEKTVIATNEDVDAGTSTTKLVTVAGLRRGSPYLGSATKTSGNTSVSSATEQAIAGISLEVTVPRAGRVRLTVTMSTRSTSLDDILLVRIKEGTNARADFTTQPNSSNTVATTSQYQHLSVILQAVTAGVHTYTLSIVRSAGTGTITVVPSALAPVQISAEMMD